MIVVLTLSLKTAVCLPDSENLLVWHPVRIGAGGFVTGFVAHPADPTIQYCRTDVGNAYRWDSTSKQWVPMLVSNHGGVSSAISSAAPAPSSGGVESIAIDPQNKNVVYMAFKPEYSSDVASEFPSVKGSVFKSMNGGRTFVGSDLNVDINPNSNWRTEGERMAVDPHNGNIIYYGTNDNGLWRSVDGGLHWTRAADNNAPGSSNVIIGVRFDPTSGTVSSFDQSVTKTLYAITLDGNVSRSSDGGNRWNDITAGTNLEGKCAFSTVDSSGRLWVVQDNSQFLWSYKAGIWSSSQVDFAWGQTLGAAAIDPHSSLHLWAVGVGGALSRSIDGGVTWIPCGHDLAFANTLGWMPQATSLYSWRSNAGIYYDSAGSLNVPEGNEGVLTYHPTGNESDLGEHDPHWSIRSQGIEEFVTHDVIVPPGGPTIVAVEDATGFVIPSLSTFTAVQIPLQNQLISCGTGLAYCPNEPRYVTVVTADEAHTGSGLSYSGFSSDGGQSWSQFKSSPSDQNGNPINEPGSIAVSCRNGWGLGQDHLVWLPCGNHPAYWSHDGGETWHAGSGFPTGNGYWVFALKQRDLKADPFVPDKFYYIASWSGGCYVTIDGGETWSLESGKTLPAFTHHGQLEVNRAVHNDLWFVDGWEGASQHGLWHSQDGGCTFVKNAFFRNAITLALGGGSGKPGDKPFSAYVYGRSVNDSAWGIFRSNDGGGSWQRVSYYPAGIFDIPTCMAASWDTYDKVIVGFGGNSFVYSDSR